MRKEADAVAIAKFEKRRKSPEVSRSDWVLLSLAGPLIGYGLEAERAILYWGVLVLLGAAIRAGVHIWLHANIVFVLKYMISLSFGKNSLPQRTVQLMAFKRKYASTIWWHALWYSIWAGIPGIGDLFTPKALVRSEWALMPPLVGHSKATEYFIIHRVLAFGLGTLALAGVAGLIK